MLQMDNVVVESKIDKDSSSESVYYGNVDIVHAEGITGKDVKVAVLDVMFDTSNPKLIDRVVEAKSFRNGLDTQFVAQSNDNDDLTVHGTAVAEIITDVAPEARIISI